MTDTQVSPISQLLYTLGITREDLNKRSDQMRQFLTADTSMPPRVPERDGEHRSRSGSDLRSSSRSVASSASLARSLSRASSSSLRDGTPPATPMEMVLERQRRQRKSRKGREREASRNVAHPASPSPSSASQSVRSLNTSMHSRDGSRCSDAGGAESAHNIGAEVNDPPPVTPQKNKYYRDHTNLSTDSASRKMDLTCKTETPTPTRPVAQQPSQSMPQPQYYAYPGYMAYPHFMPVAFRPPQASSSSIPITPHLSTSSPLPPSSPPPASSPMSSSPARGVNLVSSPGPMGPAPEENEYDNLPYKLPPGPYSSNKPDLSYAALVGRAILSSPEHRLTLQEIYDWITIVYPHYKRGETTWMNSIRHVLSTTDTLGIYDEDLECFKDGGFKKQLCKDYINGTDGKDKGVGSSKGKSKARKRGADDDDIMDVRNRRNPERKRLLELLLFRPSCAAAPFMGSASMSSHPLFPPTRPTTHHQPYYQTAQQSQSFASEVIFPPLPPTAAFNRVVNHYSASLPVQVTTTSDTQTSETCPSPSSLLRSSPIPSLPSVSSSTTSSVPELTPNRSSSSPPSSMPATSDADIDMHSSSRPSSAASLLSEISATVLVAEIIFNTTLLGPVRFWGQSPKESVLQPGIELLAFDSDDDEGSSLQDKKGKKKQTSRKNSMFPPFPTSPTLNLRVKQSYTKTDDIICRPTTPISSREPPSTPPRSTTHQISSIRTPLSHKGLHMSPNASLAHYNGGSSIAPLDLAAPDAAPAADEDDPMRTPRKRGSQHPGAPAAGATAAASVFGHPVTPRRLVFPPDSPFRTPMAGSPFRTPGSRSPTGIFGKGQGTLLYDSPGYGGSPKWW
ncbi:hypothetical protein BJ912DRAFT_945100 [Pholiota molesta]|nr:hypothetical protein BJ912DRAFT_945100 [Pholiota molesta]